MSLILLALSLALALNSSNRSLRSLPSFRESLSNSSALFLVISPLFKAKFHCTKSPKSKLASDIDTPFSFNQENIVPVIQYSLG